MLKQVRDKVVGGKKIGKKKKRDKKVPTPTTESWKTPDNIAAAKEIFCTQVPSTFETQIGKVCTVIINITSLNKLTRLHIL